MSARSPLLPMSAVSFVLGFLAVGIIGAKVLASAEPTVSDQIGAFGALVVFSYIGAVISTFCYAKSAKKRSHRHRWFTALVGGAVAGGIFCAALTVFHTRLWDALGLRDWEVLLTFGLALVLSSLAALLWPRLGTMGPAFYGSN